MENQVLYRNSIGFSLILIVMGCFADPTANLTVPTKNIENVKLYMVNNLVYSEKNPISAKLYRLEQNSLDTLEITSYLNGEAHGEWKKFYPSNKINEVRYFKNGQKTGLYQAWWANGNKQLAYQFIADEYDGLCKEWNEQGQLTRIMNYKKGHEEGEQKWWYDSGKIKANYVIKNGRRYGLLGTKNCINVSDSVFKN